MLPEHSASAARSPPSPAPCAPLAITDPVPVCVPLAFPVGVGGAYGGHASKAPDDALELPRVMPSRCTDPPGRSVSYKARCGMDTLLTLLDAAAAGRVSAADFMRQAVALRSAAATAADCMDRFLPTLAPDPHKFVPVQLDGELQHYFSQDSAAAKQAAIATLRRGPGVWVIFCANRAADYTGPRNPHLAKQSIQLDGTFKRTLLHQPYNINPSAVYIVYLFQAHLPDEAWHDGQPDYAKHPALPLGVHAWLLRLKADVSQDDIIQTFSENRTRSRANIIEVCSQRGAVYV